MTRQGRRCWWAGRTKRSGQTCARPSRPPSAPSLRRDPPPPVRAPLRASTAAGVRYEGCPILIKRGRGYLRMRTAASRGGGGRVGEGWSRGCSAQGVARRSPPQPRPTRAPWSVFSVSSRCQRPLLSSTRGRTNGRRGRTGVDVPATGGGVARAVARRGAVPPHTGPITPSPPPLPPPAYLLHPRCDGWRHVWLFRC